MTPEGGSNGQRRWRAAALVATGIAIGVAMTATPVVSHVGESFSHLWNAHIKPKTDARYYTKAHADTQFLQGNGQAIGRAVALPRDSQSVVFFLSIPGAVDLAYLCPVGGGEGTLQIGNIGIEAMNVFVESGQANPAYTALAVEDTTSVPAAAAGDSFHIQAQGEFGVLTIEAATVHRATDCHVQAQAVLTG